MPLHAGGNQQLAVGFAQLTDFSRDHAPHRLGEIAQRALGRPRQPPGVAVFDDTARVAQVPHEVGHEQWTAIGLAVNHHGKVGGKRMCGKLLREISFDVGRLEKLECDLFEGAARP